MSHMMQTKAQTNSDSPLAMLQERAASNQPSPLAELREISWDSIVALGDQVTAVGPRFSSTVLGRSESQNRHFVELLPNTESWRKTLAAAKSSKLIVVDHSIWDHPNFVQDGLAQLCHVLDYRGHFLWTGGPNLWPRRAQTRASILRLCSLHGLRLVRHIRVPAGQENMPAMRGWLLERRDPIQTLVNG